MKFSAPAFVRLEEYARSASRQPGGRGKYDGHAARRESTRHTVTDIIGEAERHPDHCRHVADPRPPRVLFGVSPRTVEAEACANAGRATDRLGRRVKRDAAILGSAVTSYPRTWDEIRADPTGMVGVRAWLRAEKRFWNQHFGLRVRCILLHTDEPRPNLHILLLPELVPTTLANGRMVLVLDICSVSPMHTAVREAKASGATGAQVRNAARLANARLQQLYASKVGMALGLRAGDGRTGPRLPRFEARVRTEVRRRTAHLEAQLAEAEATVRRGERALVVVEAMRRQRSQRLSPEQQAQSECRRATLERRKGMVRRAAADTLTGTGEYFAQRVRDDGVLLVGGPPPQPHEPLRPRPETLAGFERRRGDDAAVAQLREIARRESNRAASTTADAERRIASAGMTLREAAGREQRLLNELADRRRAEGAARSELNALRSQWRADQGRSEAISQSAERNRVEAREAALARTEAEKRATNSRAAELAAIGRAQDAGRDLAVAHAALATTKEVAERLRLDAEGAEMARRTEAQRARALEAQLETALVAKRQAEDALRGMAAAADVSGRRQAAAESVARRAGAERDEARAAANAAVAAQKRQEQILHGVAFARVRAKAAADAAWTWAGDLPVGAAAAVREVIKHVHTAASRPPAPLAPAASFAAVPTTKKSSAGGRPQVPDVTFSSEHTVPAPVAALVTALRAVRAAAEQVDTAAGPVKQRILAETGSANHPAAASAAVKSQAFVNARLMNPRLDCAVNALDAHLAALPEPVRRLERLVTLGENPSVALQEIQQLRENLLETMAWIPPAPGAQARHRYLGEILHPRAIMPAEPATTPLTESLNQRHALSAVAPLLAVAPRHVAPSRARQTR